MRPFRSRRGALAGGAGASEVVGAESLAGVKGAASGGRVRRIGGASTPSKGENDATVTAALAAVEDSVGVPDAEMETRPAEAGGVEDTVGADTVGAAVAGAGGLASMAWVANGSGSATSAASARRDRSGPDRAAGVGVGSPEAARMRSMIWSLRARVGGL